MTTYYVDPDAAGANDGSSWADAWTTLQTAADTAVAGDTVYCRGAETLAAGVDFDTNDGLGTGSPIKIIGCNAAGAVDGTRYVLDGANVASYCLNVNVDFVHFENFHLKRSTARGQTGGSGGASCVFNNVLSELNGSHGFWARYPVRSIYIRCIAQNNTDEGFEECQERARYLFCKSIGNGNNGFDEYSYYQVYVGCLAADNGENGFGYKYGGTGGAMLVNCVGDGNTGAGARYYNYTTFIGCRFTNNGAGIREYSSGSYTLLYGWTYLAANTTDIDATYLLPIAYDDVADTNETGVDDGYVDQPNGDYNLAEDATLRSVAIELD